MSVLQRACIWYVNHKAVAPPVVPGPRASWLARYWFLALGPIHGLWVWPPIAAPVLMYGATLTNNMLPFRSCTGTRVLPSIPGWG